MGEKNKPYPYPAVELVGLMRRVLWQEPATGSGIPATPWGASRVDAGDVLVCLGAPVTQRRASRVLFVAGDVLVCREVLEVGSFSLADCVCSWFLA